MCILLQIFIVAILPNVFLNRPTANRLITKIKTVYYAVEYK